MPKAIWKGVVLAESDDTIIVEANHYFPRESLNWEYFRESETTTVCSWKGTASYYDVVLEGTVNHDAAWCYRRPTSAAKKISGRVAFWRGVRIEP